MTKLPNGLISFGKNANCTLALCPVEASILRYQPSIPQNVAIIALFGVSLLIHLGQGIRWRSWDFMIMLIIGCIDEIIGYVGRLLLNKNPFAFIPFVIQTVVCITTAPVFFCSAIYVLLSRTINHLDRAVSRFNPKIFIYTFIPSDILSLVLQAAGGALSATQAGTNNKTGVRISMAGLVLQVITLVLFMGLFLDYIFRYHRKSKAGQLSTSIKLFLTFLFLAVLVIFARCAFRVKELEDGYDGEMIHDEKGFMVLEAGMMVLAVYCLHIAHPGIAFSSGSKPMKSNYTSSEEGIDASTTKKPNNSYNNGYNNAY
ncbi:RTA1-domain-containing protein [Thozetella sp. PMI_491]|nr:RTA1-domain-containing protein [Thozetella sp. PMI_491]